jgi:hippurate hydrolase
LRVAVFSDQEGGSTSVNCIKSTLRILSTNAGFHATTISPAAIRAGGLDDYDVVMFPGGSGAGQARALQKNGCAKVERFVARGGGFVGTCAGAYLAALGYSTETSWLELVNARAVDVEHWKRGGGSVQIKIVNISNLMLAGVSNTFSAQFFNGPLFVPGGSTNLPPYEQEAIYLSDIHSNAPAGVMPGTTCMTASRYQSGRCVLFSFHPELTPGLEPMEVRAVNWAAGQGGGDTTAQETPASHEPVQSLVGKEYPGLFELYKNLHSHPELSGQEANSAAQVAEELGKAGFQVTTGVGSHGVVGVLSNGAGPTVLVRTELDALPVKEKTGLPYASKVVTTNAQGQEVPVAHACGHDVHMTCLVGVARVLVQLKDRWSGTLVFIAQPAEETGQGARGMLADGLFKRFPRPDVCLALHDSAEMPAGAVGYTPGWTQANVDSVDIIVRGVGGHGAYPHKTKDPVVLAAQIVLGLQTIVSREIRPGEPAVVTVGSIHGGTRYNVIPDEVSLQLTVRSYADEVRHQTLEAIKRIVRGQAIAAGIPDDRMPEVKFGKDYTPALWNPPELTQRLADVFKAWLGETNVWQQQPTMGGEDFAEYGRTEAKIPICMFRLGGVDPEKYAESQRTGQVLPSLHSPLWAPSPEPTIKTGVTAMTAAVLELMQPPKR